MKIIYYICENFPNIFHSITENMKLLKRLHRYLTHPWLMLRPLLVYTARLWPDDLYLRMWFFASMGKRLDLKNPRTFSEKLQWLKLYNRQPEYTTMVDKYAVKKYVADIIGEEYIIPTLGVWDRFDDIDFDALPDSFVLKTTHGGGGKGVVVCKDKHNFDFGAAKKRLEKSLAKCGYMRFREWPYKDVPRRIIAEQYMEDAQYRELRDYKFFCFDGKAKAMFVVSERFNADLETRFDFYDMEFNRLPFTQKHPRADVEIRRPEKFDEMKALAEKLSAGIPHVRADFYEINQKVYFGELTFFHYSGLVPFTPEEWDLTFGSWITLPEKVMKIAENE